MLRLPLLVLLATQSILAYDVLKALERIESDVNMEGRLVPDIPANKFATLADLPTYIAVVQLKPDDKIIGAVIIVNRYWVVGLQNVLGSFKATPEKLIVYAKVLSIADLTANDVIKRKAKEMKGDPDYDEPKPLIKPLVLIRVCPSFPVGLAATLSTTSFPSNTDVRMMRYKTNNMFYVEKKVGEICECQDILDFEKDPVTSTHVCLQEHETIKGENSDLGSLIVAKKSDGAVIGFLIKEQDADKGEIVINVPKFSTWITTNAVPTAP